MAIVIYDTVDLSGNPVETVYNNIYGPTFLPGTVFVNPDGLASILANNIDPEYWVVNAANQIIAYDPATYTQQLGVVQQTALNDMGITVQNYINSRYPVREQTSLSFLFTEGVYKNQPQVVAAVQAAWDWTVTVIQGYLYYAEQVMASTTINQVMALTLDLSVYNATDPNISMNTILAMQGRAIPTYPPSGSVPVSGSPI